jgi:glycosyltransferase involved in cell wall biosynthesis
MLSIAVCTFRNPGLLRECLNSIVNQTLGPQFSEILVINNGCDQAVHQVVLNVAETGAPIRVIDEPVLGLTVARARAVRECKSRYIAFVDDDVRLQGDWVRNAIEFLECHSDVGILGGQIGLKWETTPDATSLRCSHLLCELDYGDKALKLPIDGRFHLPGAVLVVNKAALVATGWLERQILRDRSGKTLSSGGDTEIILRIKNLGHDVWYSPSLRAIHFIPTSRMSSRYLQRLAFGIARSDSQIWVISAGTPHLGACLVRVVKKFLSLGRRTLAWLYHDKVSRRCKDDFRRIQISEAAGSFVSALHLMIGR